MAFFSKKSPPKRREFKRIGIPDLTCYAMRWSLAPFASIGCRASGAFMVLMLPFMLWMFDNSVTSEISFARFTALFDGQLFLPGWIWKLVVISMFWALVHHILAGIKHLIMDAAHITINKRFSGISALAIYAISLPMVAAFTAWLFGLFDWLLKLF